VTFLAEAEGGWALVLAADVLPYLGELEPLLAGLGRACAPGALVGLSVETTSVSPWELRRSGRYAHDPDALVELANRLGFRLLARRSAVLRREGGSPVRGELLLLTLRPPGVEDVPLLG
jgi:predicted TPR repeat methyltransferase